MGEKEEEELKRYLLDSNVKILFEGKNPTPVEITEFPLFVFLKRGKGKKYWKLYVKK